jgi:phosphohistidine phosphatase SixA
MGELYVVRHGEAHKPLESDFGASYSLTPKGRGHVLEAGKALRSVIAAGSIESIECAPTLRSLDSAKLLAGALETSVAIHERDALHHRGLEAPELIFELNKWIYDKTSGVYVTAMSRRAIVALLAPVMGLGTAEVNAIESDSDIQIPCASITRLEVSERGLSIVKIGMTSEQLEA